LEIELWKFPPFIIKRRCAFNIEYLYNIKMENQFIPKAIEIVSKAIEADNEGEFEKVSR